MVWILCIPFNGFFPGWGNRIERTFVYIWPLDVKFFCHGFIWVGLDGQWLSDRKDFEKEREVAIFNGELASDIPPQ
jgi:hypothetical protein